MMEQEFGPAISSLEAEERERGESQQGIFRRTSLATLTKSSEELAKIARETPDVFMDMVQLVVNHHSHAKANLELAEAALARLILIGEAN
jgi:hypothetical protein